MVAYDIMEADGQDVRPEPLEERRTKLLSRSNKALRDGHGDGAAIFRHAYWMELEGIVLKRIGSRYGGAPLGIGEGLELGTVLPPPPPV
jgi:ATP-dependent DNA ligase